MKLLLLIALTSWVVPLPAWAASHIWSKKGTVVSLVVGDEAADKSGPFEISSPYHSQRVEIAFRHGKGDGEATPVAVVFVSKKKSLLRLDADWVQVEALWSPDSQSVALTGNFNGYTNSTKIFKLANEKPEIVDLHAPSKRYGEYLSALQRAKCR